MRLGFIIACVISYFHFFFFFILPFFVNFTGRYACVIAINSTKSRTITIWRMCLPRRKHFGAIIICITSAPIRCLLSTLYLTSLLWTHHNRRWIANMFVPLCRTVFFKATCTMRCINVIIIIFVFNTVLLIIIIIIIFAIINIINTTFVNIDIVKFIWHWCIVLVRGK